MPQIVVNAFGLCAEFQQLLANRITYRLLMPCLFARVPEKNALSMQSSRSLRRKLMYMEVFKHIQSLNDSVFWNMPRPTSIQPQVAISD